MSSHNIGCISYVTFYKWQINKVLFLRRERRDRASRVADPGGPGRIRGGGDDGSKTEAIRHALGHRDRLDSHARDGRAGLPRGRGRHVPDFLAESAADLIRHVCDYMLDSGTCIRPGETMATSPRHDVPLREGRAAPRPGRPLRRGAAPDRRCGALVRVLRAEGLRHELKVAGPRVARGPALPKAVPSRPPLPHFTESRGEDSLSLRLSGFPTSNGADHAGYGPAASRQLQAEAAIRDRSGDGVVNRRHNGLYLWGDTGVGKTYSIEETLAEAQERGIRSYRKLEGRCYPGRPLRAGEGLPGPHPLHRRRPDAGAGPALAADPPAPLRGRAASTPRRGRTSG